MSKLAPITTRPTAEEREQMHVLYRQGGERRSMAPHVVYSDADCPHGCGAHLQAIDFRLEDHGKAIHEALVRA